MLSSLSRSKFLPPLLIFIYSLAVFLYSQQDTLRERYILDDDWPQHLLWLYRYSTGFIPTDDFFLETALVLQPWGYALLLRTLAFFFHPLFISKVFPFFTLFATCWFAYFLIKPRFGWILAIGAMVLFSNIPQERMIGFYARAFAFPLLMAYLFFRINDRPRGIKTTLLLSALFYPVTFLLAGAIEALHSLQGALQSGWKVQWKQDRMIWLFLVLGLTILGLKSRQVQQHPNTGRFLSKQEILRLPEFGAGGRVDFIRDMDPKLAFTHLRQAKALLPLAPAEPWIILALFLLVGWCWGKGQSKYPAFDRILLFLGGSALGLFFLARGLLPQLFLPERYLYYGYLPLVYLLIIRGLALGGQLLGNKPGYHAFALVGLIYSGLIYIPPRDLGVKHYEEHRGLYEAIRTFPETRLIAGPPDISSQIPSFCRQPVLMSDEAAHAIYFRNYYHYVKPRMDDFVEAYTTRDSTVLRKFLIGYGIDYLILDKAFLEKGNMWFYEPYASQVKGRMKAINPAELAINKLPVECIQKVDWRYWLLDVSAYLGASEAGRGTE